MRRLLYLLDTNILSEPTRQLPNERVIKKMTQYEFQIALATPVYYELLTGCRKLEDSKKRDKLMAYLNGFIATLPILSYDAKAADWHSAETARLNQKGLTPAFIDTQTAAIAATRQMTLITRNMNDFKYFAGLDVENWFL